MLVISIDILWNFILYLINNLTELYLHNTIYTLIYCLRKRSAVQLGIKKGVSRRQFRDFPGNAGGRKCLVRVQQVTKSAAKKKTCTCDKADIEIVTLILCDGSGKIWGFSCLF